jgi:hypothetical protein
MGRTSGCRGGGRMERIKGGVTARRHTWRIVKTSPEHAGCTQIHTTLCAGCPLGTGIHRIEAGPIGVPLDPWMMPRATMPPRTHAGEEGPSLEGFASPEFDAIGIGDMTLETVDSRALLAPRISKHAV